MISMIRVGQLLIAGVLGFSQIGIGQEAHDAIQSKGVYLNSVEDATFIPFSTRLLVLSRKLTRGANGSDFTRKSILTIVDAVTAKTLSDLPIRTLQLQGGKNPESNVPTAGIVRVSGDGHLVLVYDSSAELRIYTLKSSGLTLLRSIYTTWSESGQMPADIALTSDGRYAYVACSKASGGAVIERYDLSGSILLATMNIQQGRVSDGSLTISPSNKVIALATDESRAGSLRGRLLLFDAELNGERHISLSSVPAYPTLLADGEIVYFLRYKSLGNVGEECVRIQNTSAHDNPSPLCVAGADARPPSVVSRDGSTVVAFTGKQDEGGAFVKALSESFAVWNLHTGALVGEATSEYPQFPGVYRLSVSENGSHLAVYGVGHGRLVLYDLRTFGSKSGEQ